MEQQWISAHTSTDLLWKRDWKRHDTVCPRKGVKNKATQRKYH